MTPKGMRSALVSAALVLAACGSGDASVGSDVVVRDSAGVTIVESPAPTARWTLGAAPELRIGEVEGEPAYQFSRVLFAGRLADGRVVVMNQAGREVRFFGADGVHRTTLGGQGGGPGEFGLLLRAVLLGAGDTLRIHDGSNRRLVAVGPDETLASERSLGGSDFFARVSTYLGEAPGGRFVATIRPELSSPVAGDGETTFVRDTLVVVVATTDDAGVVDTVARVPGPQSMRSASASADGRMVQVMTSATPFAHDPYHALLGERLLAGSTAQAELRISTLDGRLERIVRLTDQAAQPLDADVRGRYVDFVREAAVGRGADAEAAIQRGRDQMDGLPEGHTLPAFGRVLVDTEQRLWVRDYIAPWAGDLPQQWTVLDGEGRPLARMETPVGLDVMHIGAEHVTGVVRDELDVEYVVVYRIETSGGA